MRNILLAVVLLTCFIAKAQEDTLDIYAMSLEDLMKVEVVTASKKAQKLSDAPSIISAVSKREIQKMGVNSLIDILKNIPGIETSMGVLGDYRVSIRGVRKDGNILVLIDGHHINDFYDGKSIYDFPIENIERIEVIRGPGSALFGSNALAGVINIITNKKTNLVSIAAGLHNTYNANFVLNKNTEKWNFGVAGGYSRSDGQNVSPYSGTLENNSAETNRWLNDIHFQTQVSNQNLNISLFGVMRKNGAWVGPIYELANDSELKSNQIIGDIAYKIKVNDNLSITPKLYSDYINHNYLLQEQPDNYVFNNQTFTDGMLSKEKYDGLLLGSDLQLNYSFGESLSLIGGFVYENLSMKNYSMTKNYYIVGKQYLGYFTNMASETAEIDLNQRDKHRDIYALYLQFDYKFDKFAFTVGSRFDSYSDFGNSFNPRAGIVWKPVELLSFKALYGHAFRAPTFKELYDKTSAFDKNGYIGNEELKSESVNSTELGVELSTAKLLVRLNGFFNSNENIISVYDPEGGGKVGRYQNIGNIKSFGGEFEATFIPISNFSFFVNTSYFFSNFYWNEEMEVIKPSEIEYIIERGSREMTNIPQLRINSGFNLNFFKFSTFASVNYGADSKSNNRFTSEFQNAAVIPSYLLANFSFIFHANKKLSIGVHANNIGNIKYSDPDESTNIDKLGNEGMAQPANCYLLKATYSF